MTKLKWPKNLVVVRHGQSTLNIAQDLFEDNLGELLEKQKK